MTRNAVLTMSEMQVVVRGRVEIPGPEDIVIDHVTGVAFVSSQQRRSATGRIITDPEKAPGGAIYALDLNEEALTRRLLVDQESLGFPFHPRGLSLFCGPNGERRLIAISDRTSQDHVVELFDVEEGRLRHVRTVGDREHLISPNDLVALDADRFYVTNDHGSRGLLLQTLENGVALPWSTVVFYDGSQFHTVARRLVFANGIALDHDRKRIYVAATRTKNLHSYAWDPDHPAQELTDHVEIKLPGYPDNLEWDEEGNLWVGADPSYLKLFLYFAMPSLMPKAPSLILCIHFGEGEHPRIETVFHDETGEQVSASSVASVYSRGPVRRLLIGAPADDHLLDCELRGT